MQERLLAEAENHLQTAVERQLDIFTDPKTAMPISIGYRTGREENSAWTTTLSSGLLEHWAGLRQLLRLANSMPGGRLSDALEHIDSSIATNRSIPKAYNLNGHSAQTKPSHETI
jgi:hypothetical protein